MEHIMEYSQYTEYKKQERKKLLEAFDIISKKIDESNKNKIKKTPQEIKDEIQLMRDAYFKDDNGDYVLKKEFDK